MKQCRICGNKNIKIDYKVNYSSPIGYSCDKYIQELYCCDKCGYLGVLNPLNQAELTKNYKTLSKYEGNICEKGKESFSERKGYVVIANFQRNFLSKYLVNVNSMLDIGASSGYALSLYNVEKKIGVEPSSKNAKIAKEYYNVDLYSGTYEDWDREFPTEQYDLITMSHVLEHLNNPKSCIESLKNHSKRYIFIEVPTFDLRYSDRPFGFFSEEHISYFTIESLANLMTGFRLVQSCINLNPEIDEAVGFPSVLTLWEKQDEGKNVCLRNRRFKMIFSTRQILKQYIKTSNVEFKRIKKIINNCHKFRTISIWGAGSHTYKLLANDDIFNSLKLKNIFDNNPQKWGGAIRGIPITNFNRDFDCILVSSNSAQAEIVEHIKSLGVSEDKIITLY